MVTKCPKCGMLLWEIQLKNHLKEHEKAKKIAKDC